MSATDADGRAARLAELMGTEVTVDGSIYRVVFAKGEG